MSDATVAETTEAQAASMAAVWPANVKKVFEQIVALTEAVNAERSVNAQRENEFNDTLKNLFVRQVETGQQLFNLAMSNAVSLSNQANNNTATIAQAAATNAQLIGQRAAGNQATLDNITLSDAMTNLKAAGIARDNMMSKVAMDIDSVTKKAEEAAVAAQTASTAAQAAASGFGVMSSPVPQGTTGVAQASLQTAEAAATNAMMTQLAVANNAIMAQIAKLAEVVDVLLLKVTADTTTVKPA